MSIKKTALIAIVAFFTFAAGTAPAGGNGVSFTYASIEDLNPFIYNPCTEEMMQTSGTLRFGSKERVGPDGTYFYLLKIRAFDLHGVGLTTGNMYDGHGVDPNLTQRVTPDVTGVLNVTSRIVWIDRATKQNWFITFVNKITVNANGELVVDRFYFNFECR